MKLHFENDKTSDIEITKETKKYLFFTAKDNRCKYREEKATGKIQISPYWNTSEKMYIER